MLLHFDNDILQTIHRIVQRSGSNKDKCTFKQTVAHTHIKTHTFARHNQYPVAIFGHTF